MLEETLGSGAVPPILHQNVQHHAVLIHRAPQIVQHAADADEHLIKMPGVAGLRSSPTQPPGEVRTELQAPVPELSWVTTMPRSARISSTSRKLRLNT